MNRLTFSSLILFASWTTMLFAQETLDSARFVCQYNYVYQSDTIKKRVLKDIVRLQVGSTVSKCYSYLTFQLDSLLSTPGGAQIAEQRSAQAIENFTKHRNRDRLHSETLSMKGTTVTYQNFPAGKTTVTDLDGEYIIYEDELYPQEWDIQDSTKTILNYTCQKAVCKFRGREWTAWFAPEVPVSAGPWKLGGLPGLIMEAYDSGNQYAFTITGLQSVTEQPIVFSQKFLSHAKPTPMERKKFLKAKDFKRRYDDSGIKVTSASGAVVKIEPKYDFIERDYE